MVASRFKPAGSVGLEVQLVTVPVTVGVTVVMAVPFVKLNGPPA